jgi:hypothetical protein
MVVYRSRTSTGRLSDGGHGARASRGLGGTRGSQSVQGMGVTVYTVVGAQGCPVSLVHTQINAGAVVDACNHRSRREEEERQRGRDGDGQQEEAIARSSNF